MKKYILKLSLMIVDFLALSGLFYLTHYIRDSIYTNSVPLFSAIDFKDFSFVIFIILVLFYYEKIYTLRFDFWQDTRRVAKSLFIAYFMVLALLTLTKTSLEYSRLFITLYFALSIVFLPIIKRYSKKLIFKIPYFRKRYLIIGNDTQVNIFKKEFKDNWYLGMEYTVHEYDTVIISSDGISLEKVNEKISYYLEKHNEVYVVPFVNDINFSNSNIMEYSNIRHNTIQVENKLLDIKNIFIKNSFDYVVTFMILPFFTLIHIIISILIKKDSKGDIFFKQHRLGKDNKDFECYKYRTMYTENQDELLKEYLKIHPDEIDYYKTYHKYKNDPRITKIGRILRSTSLDELPQLINILKGEMSLVGPRPYMINEKEKLGSSKHFILKVKPGITGMWQVSGRNNLTFKERKELEVWYIKNWSLWTDFIILIKTVKVVLLKVGAK